MDKLWVYTSLALIIFLVLLKPATAEEKNFKEFTVDLPEGWNGEDRTNFLGGKGGEYLLTLGARDEKGERFLAQISIFLLNNKNGEEARKFAIKMAALQDGASEVVREGNFWTFHGEPHTQDITGQAKTRVAADNAHILIIISHDPENLGSEKITRSLKGISERARKLLGMTP